MRPKDKRWLGESGNTRYISPMPVAFTLPPDTRPLLLLRHGVARNDLPVRDRERPLAAEGRTDIEWIARRLRQQGVLPEQILCSPARRTRETAQLFRDTAGIAAECIPVAELYDGHADEYLRVVQSLDLPPVPLLLVGHNSAISDLLFLLCPAIGPRVPSLPAGGVAVLAVTNGPWALLGADTVRYIGMLLPRDRLAK